MIARERARRGVGRVNGADVPCYHSPVGRGRPAWRARGRAAWPLAAALVAHVLVGAAVVVRALPAPHDSASASRPELAIELVEEAALPAAPELEPEPDAREASLTPPRERVAGVPLRAERSATPVPGAIAGASRGAGEAALETTGAGTWTFRPTAGVELGLKNRAGLASGAVDAPPERAGPRPASSTGGLVEALDAADVALGLGHGGPVRSAVDLAARTPDAPTFGTATFAVALGTDGSVKVSVVAASSDRERWESLGPAVRNTLLDAARRKALKGNGVLVTVKVDASEQFPGGGRPTPDDKQGLGAHASAGGVTETKEHVEIELPSASIGYRTRSCGVVMAVGAGGIGLGGGCEPGVAMRVVATKILSEQRF